MKDKDLEPKFGYLEIAEIGASSETGPWVGGYLIVTAAGRPLEFHCTAPVVASRAQQILYGKSLRPFVLGDHIGATLVGKAKFQPNVLLTTDADAAAAGRAKSLGQAQPLPTVLLADEEDREDRPDRLPDLPVNAQLLSRDTSPEGRAVVVQLLQQLSDSVDLSEPFDRIREAIGEAQQAVAPAEEASLRDVA